MLTHIFHLFSRISVLLASTWACATLAPVTDNLPRFDFNPGEITTLCAQTIQQNKEATDQLVLTPPTQRNFDNTYVALDNLSSQMSEALGPMLFMRDVTPDPQIHKEAMDCLQKVIAYTVVSAKRRDVYDFLKNQTGRNDDERRLVYRTVQNYERDGMALADDKLRQLATLQEKLSDMENQFEDNLAKDQSTFLAKPEELKGAPDDFVHTMKRDAQGNVIVSTSEPDYLEFLTTVSSSEARRKMLVTYYNKGGDANVQLLQQAIAVRTQIANLLGFQTWADYQVAPKMAQTKERVYDFLNGLRDKLRTRYQFDAAQLLTYKKQLDPTATALDPWDIFYLTNELKKKNYTIDEEKIREYFPADTVINGMFSVYSQMLGVIYEEVPNPKVWSPGVKLYRILNSGDRRLIGYFYTDLYPRPNKYSHTAAASIISGRRLPSGDYNHPVSAIMGNLSRPTDGKPSLLSHQDVETIFHEFGHVMHQTLTRAPYGSLSGSSVANDFVEAPSQMLENWVWQPEILTRLSGHYLTHEPLPNDLLTRMAAARDFQAGMFNTKQLVYALFDMKINSTTSGTVDVTEGFNKEYFDLTGIPQPAGTHFASSFGHLMGGYSAGYYGYLWSKVYAQDMFTVFKNGGLTNPTVGARYRREILEKGDMQEAIVLLRNFIGREPNAKAFFDFLHVAN
jgi:thimet oligopeptidase